MDVFLKGATSAKSKAKSKIDKEPRAIPWVEK